MTSISDIEMSSENDILNIISVSSGDFVRDKLRALFILDSEGELLENDSKMLSNKNFLLCYLKTNEELQRFAKIFSINFYETSRYDIILLVYGEYFPKPIIKNISDRVEISAYSPYNKLSQYYDETKKIFKLRNSYYEKRHKKLISNLLKKKYNKLQEIKAFIKIGALDDIDTKILTNKDIQTIATVSAKYNRKDISPFLFKMVSTNLISCAALSRGHIDLAKKNFILPYFTLEKEYLFVYSAIRSGCIESLNFLKKKGLLKFNNPSSNSISKEIKKNFNKEEIIGIAIAAIKSGRKSLYYSLIKDIIIEEKFVNRILKTINKLKIIGIFFDDTSIICSLESTNVNNITYKNTKKFSKSREDI